MYAEIIRACIINKVYAEIIRAYRINKVCWI